MSTALDARIRSGVRGDLPAVLMLLQGGGLPTADVAEKQTLRMWVLEAGDSLLGVVALERSTALLRSLAIAPEQRNQGFGRHLVVRLERDARTDGIKRLVLLTETAEAFFARLSYEVIDRGRLSEELRQSDEFRWLCPVSAVCMSKSLAAPAAVTHDRPAL